MNDNIRGLSALEVQDRINKGQNNVQVKIKGKTVGQIIFSNLFTYLNLIIYSLAAILFIIGEYINSIFVFTTLFNMMVGIVQEIRIKRAIDRLSVINQTQVSVVRDGVAQSIDLEEIVLDDIIYLNTGDQICADSEIIKSVNLVVNESLLTGEADAVPKNPSDKVLSGSYVTNGYAYARVLNVGKDNYASKIILEVKKYKKASSQLLRFLNKVIKTIGIVILPLGGLLFASTYFRGGVTVTQAIVTTIGGITGMIPQGLIVLSNVSFALGIIKMAKHNAFLKSLPSIETFSRVNVICFDKTGTLTYGNPYVDHVDYLIDKEDAIKIMSNINSSLPKSNPTSEALVNYFGTAFEFANENVLPFSSEKKISGVTFVNERTYVIGAYEYIFSDRDSKYYETIQSYSSKGYRVIVLAHTKKDIEEDFIDDCELNAIIILRDKIKPDTKKIIEYLKKEKVDTKVISGDNHLTVAMIAAHCGIDNSDKAIDMSTVGVDADFDLLAHNYTVFGRTTPHQKYELIKALKRSQKVTAMVGDGVNDILALKESDFSIAMANGSEAAKNIAEVVLMDSNFSAFPKILTESRKIINNITNLATLYITKTVYSFTMVMLSIFLGIAFPFSPIQLSIISTTTIGFPSFFFLIFPSDKKPEGGIIKSVVFKSLFFGLVVIFNLIAIQVLGLIFNATDMAITTLSLIATEFIALTLVLYVSNPMNKKKRIFLSVLTTIFVLVLFLFHNILTLEFRLNVFYFICILITIVSCYGLMKFHKVKL